MVLNSTVQKSFAVTFELSCYARCLPVGYSNNTLSPMPQSLPTRQELCLLLTSRDGDGQKPQKQRPPHGGIVCSVYSTPKKDAACSSPRKPAYLRPPGVARRAAISCSWAGRGGSRLLIGVGFGTAVPFSQPRPCPVGGVGGISGSSLGLALIWTSRYLAVASLTHNWKMGPMH